MAYAPDPELEVDTRVAVARLAAGSGLPLAVDPLGTRVEAAPIETMWSTRKDGSKFFSCGETVIAFYPDRVVDVVIRIAYPPPTNCYQDISLTISHEMIHSIRRDVDHAGTTHSEHGLFQAYANPKDDKLEDSSLNALCEAAACETFNPER